MKLPPREATAEGDLTIPFQQSALKSTADQDPFFQHLKIRYVKAADTADLSQVHCIVCHCCCLCKSRPGLAYSNQAKTTLTSSRKRFASSLAILNCCWQLETYWQQACYAFLHCLVRGIALHTLACLPLTMHICLHIVTCLLENICFFTFSDGFVHLLRCLAARLLSTS